jgi:nucleoside-diphosphate-sugar epimerase
VRALVTGSAGFLGRHFKQALPGLGFEVHAVDILATDPKESGDCRTIFASDGHYDLVVHCAAFVGGRQAIEGTPLSLSVNLDLDSALFRWAARTGQGRVIYISSSAIYPVVYQDRPDHAGLLEESMAMEPTGNGLGTWHGEPDSIYGWTKLTGEVLAGYARAAGAMVTVIRPFSGYGEDQAATYPFRAMAERAKARKDPFEIWGDGKQTRDFIHVSDIVGSALALALNHIDGPVNLCTGLPTSMQELAEMFCKAAGYSPRFALLGDKPQGVAYRVGSNDLMSQIYAPRVSLEEGIGRALAT